MMRFIKAGKQYINIDYVTHVTDDGKILSIHYKNHKGQALVAHCKADDEEYQRLNTIVHN